MTLALNLVIKNQSIGDALKFADFQGVDGIIGVGTVDLTQGMLPLDVNATIPMVMNNLVSQGLIENQVLGIYFAPSTNYSDTSEHLLSNCHLLSTEMCRWCIDLRRHQSKLGMNTVLDRCTLQSLICVVYSMRVS